MRQLRPGTRVTLQTYPVTRKTPRGYHHPTTSFEFLQLTPSCTRHCRGWWNWRWLGSGSCAYEEYQNYTPRRTLPRIFVRQATGYNQQERLSDHVPSMICLCEFELKSTSLCPTVRKPHIGATTSRLYVVHLNRHHSASRWISTRSLCLRKHRTNSRHAVCDVRYPPAGIAQALCCGRNKIRTQSSRIFTYKCQIGRKRSFADLPLDVFTAVRYCQSHDSKNW